MIDLVQVVTAVQAAASNAQSALTFSIVAVVIACGALALAAFRACK